jgi:hypothetical protein
MEHAGVYLVLALCLGGDLWLHRRVHWVFLLALAGRLVDDSALRWVGQSHAWRAVAERLIG